MAEILGHQLGNYRLIAHLGSGGNAHVFLGKHIHIATQAAVKILATQLADEQFEQFRTEAATIARLQHPNIIRIIDFGIDDHIPYLVMEHATQGSLRHRYPLGTRVPLDVIISCVKQIASALQYAHDQKLIHRDVKPENMLLGQNDTVLLSDFGIAIVARNSASRSLQEIAGTVPYMAPELFHGRPCFASDQYALAIVAYEWLSGTRPFTGTYTEIAMQHERHMPPPLHLKVPTIPAAIESTVFTALAKDPHQRFGSVMAFANTLEKAAQFSGPQPVYSSSPQQQIPFPQNPANPPAPVLRSTVVMEPQYNPSYNPPPSPTTSAPPPTSWQGGFSRRKLIAAGTIGALAIVGGGTAFAFTHAPTMSAPVAQTPLKVKSTLPPAPTPTPTVPSLNIINSYQAHIRADTRKGVPAYDLAWSPDGNYLLSGGADQTATVYNANTAFMKLQVTGYDAIAWSPYSRLFATSIGATQASIAIYDIKAPKQILLTYTHHDDVQRIAWTANGNLIASCDRRGLINVWDPITGKTIISYSEHKARVNTVAWSPSGTFVASGGDKLNTSNLPGSDPGSAVRIWDITNGYTLHMHHYHKDNVKGVSWSPDGKMIASCGESTDKSVVAWDIMEEKLIFQYRGHTNSVETVAWSPNGKYIASGSADKTLHILDAATGKLVAQHDNTISNTVWHIVWSPLDNRRIAFSDENGVVTIAELPASLP